MRNIKLKANKNVLASNGLHPLVLDRKGQELRTAYVELHLFPEEAGRTTGIIEKKSGKLHPSHDILPLLLH